MIVFFRCYPPYLDFQYSGGWDKSSVSKRTVVSSCRKSDTFNLAVNPSRQRRISYTNLCVKRRDGESGLSGKA